MIPSPTELRSRHLATQSAKRLARGQIKVNEKHDKRIMALVEEIPTDIMADESVRDALNYVLSLLYAERARLTKEHDL